MLEHVSNYNYLKKNLSVPTPTKKQHLTGMEENLETNLAI